MKRNPLTYLAIAGGGVAAINQKKLNKWGVLTAVEMRDAQDEAGAEKYQQRVKEFRKRYAVSGLPRLAELPKFTKVEPSCGTSTLKVEMSNGRKYDLSFPSNDGTNFEVVGQATGKVQRVINFTGKYDGKTGEYSKLTSKQRNAGGSADPASETPKAIFNSYLNSANDKQDSAVESKTIMAEGANMAQAFLPLFNARCGTGGSATSESPTTSR